MKIDPLYSTSSLDITQNNGVETPMQTIRRSGDPLASSLNQDFYQQLQTQGLNNAKDILKFLAQYDMKNEGNQTIKEDRQRNVLMYARVQSEIDNSENKDAINQALLSYLSYQGLYHQFMLDLLGMTDNKEEYDGFFKPDTASFSL